MKLGKNFYYTLNHEGRVGRSREDRLWLDFYECLISRYIFVQTVNTFCNVKHYGPCFSVVYGGFSNKSNRLADGQAVWGSDIKDPDM